MRARTVIPTLLCFWMVFATFAYSTDELEKEKAATEAATAWLALVDSGRYGESWFQAAGVFRNAASKEQWTNTMRSGRAPLGNMGTRDLKSATCTTKLSNLAAGKYVVLQFETSFTNARGIIETVTPMLIRTASGRCRATSLSAQAASVSANRSD